MEKNIFENAYFGKPYKTRDGKKALYHNIISTEEGMKHYLVTVSSGFICDNCGKSPCEDDSIVSVWQEEINDEELDKLANEFVQGFDCAIELSPNQNFSLKKDKALAKSAFKFGYRKAKEDRYECKRINAE